MNPKKNADIDLLPWQTINYCTEGRTRKKIAEDEGWTCNWKNIPIDRQRPDSWSRGDKESKAAFNNGTWIDPDGKEIAKFKREITGLEIYL